MASFNATPAFAPTPRIACKGDAIGNRGAPVVADHVDTVQTQCADQIQCIPNHVAGLVIRNLVGSKRPAIAALIRGKALEPVQFRHDVRPSTSMFGEPVQKQDRRPRRTPTQQSGFMPVQAYHLCFHGADGIFGPGGPQGGGSGPQRPAIAP